MSVTTSELSRNSVPVPVPVPATKKQRFHQATAAEQNTTVEPPNLLPDTKWMAQLLPAATLTHLARRCHADDVRQRKLPCVIFFWMTVLAFGPGGSATLHQVITFTLAAQLVAGVSYARGRLSKEAVSENFRERPWQFFAAVLTYLLNTYAQVWQQLAGQPNPLVVEQLQVWLVDASVMRVALRLFQQFPARPTGKRAKWAGLKLHLGLRLFQSLPEVLALTPEKQNEHKTTFLRPVGERALYIFDLGYWSYNLLDTILERGQHVLSRLRQDCNPLILAVSEGEPQWVGQRLKSLALTGQQVDLRVHLSGNNRAHPQMQQDVRLVGQYVEPDQTWHLYITSLCDGTTYPVGLLVDLYRLRWQIEILFRNLKCVLRIANFISTTENGIRIQIYAALIHYVLTHLIILKAMQASGRKFEEFSLPYCLEGVQQVLQQTGQLIQKGAPPDWDALEARLVEVVIRNGLRPNRKRVRLITAVQTQLQHVVPAQAGAP
jgi:putative transposase